MSHHGKETPVKSIQDNLAAIQRHLRPGVTLIGIAKGQSDSAVQEALNSGLTDIGENYAQELLEHFGEKGVIWHFVGHLQTKKVRQIIDKVDWIHSVDSEKLAVEINKQAERIGKRQKILIEVNLGGEKNKSGVSETQLKALSQLCTELPHVELKGLMLLPPFETDAEKTRPLFRRLKQLKEELNESFKTKIRLSELSMGMSHDFLIAMEEGATFVRLGTALFGKRQ